MVLGDCYVTLSGFEAVIISFLGQLKRTTNMNRRCYILFPQILSKGADKHIQLN